MEAWELEVGIENLLDEEPDQEGDVILGVLGVDRAITSPWGTNGGFWYLRLQADF